MSRWSGAVKTADSLDVVEHEKSLEYQEKLKRQAELKEQAYLDSITKATNEISAADAQAAAAMHNEINLKLHEVTGPLKFEEAKAALLTYDNLKNISEHDDVELAYQQFLSDHTGPDGTYFLENYETYAQTDPTWSKYYEAIQPQGWDKWNPLYEPSKEDLERFQRRDLEVRQMYLQQNQKADDMYDVLIDKDGKPTEGYQAILDAREDAFETVLAYNDTAGSEPLDVVQVLMDEKKVKAEEINMSMDELYQSENIKQLIDDLAETEHRSRMSRSPLNYIGIGLNPSAPTNAPLIMNPTLYAELSADQSLQAAADLDPNLFMTHLGLYDEGWDILGAESSWYSEALDNPEEVLERLEAEGIDPALFGFMPENYESELDTGDLYYKELLLKAQEQAR